MTWIIFLCIAGGLTGNGMPCEKVKSVEFATEKECLEMIAPFNKKQHRDAIRVFCVKQKRQND